MGQHVELSLYIGYTDIIVSYELHIAGSTPAARCLWNHHPHTRIQYPSSSHQAITITLHFQTSSKDTLLPVSLSCHLASILQRALILFIQTLALYKSFTYLLTYLLTAIFNHRMMPLKFSDDISNGSKLFCRQMEKQANTQTLRNTRRLQALPA